MLAIGTLYLTDTGMYFLAINEEHYEAAALEIGRYNILLTKAKAATLTKAERAVLDCALDGGIDDG